MHFATHNESSVSSEFVIDLNYNKFEYVLAVQRGVSVCTSCRRLSW
jgi:hypothetical protein